MKKRTKHIILATVLALAAFGLFHALRFGVVASHIARSERADWHRFQSLVQTNDHAAVLSAAIPLIMSVTNDVLLQEAQLTTLPKEISGMDPSYISIYPAGMIVEFHGGFDHYGFRIHRGESDWEMLWYTEKERHSLVTQPLKDI